MNCKKSLMGTLINKTLMSGDYSNRSFQNMSFEMENLSGANFSGSDLRGVNFSDADLSSADLSHVKTGITPANTLVIFIAALAVSLFSGYLAMLTGHTVQIMLASTDKNVRT